MHNLLIWFSFYAMLHYKVHNLCYLELKFLKMKFLYNIYHFREKTSPRNSVHSFVQKKENKNQNCCRHGNAWSLCSVQVNLTLINGNLKPFIANHRKMIYFTCQMFGNNLLYKLTSSIWCGVVFCDYALQQKYNIHTHM